ncbi:HTH psq-type domain-containing protein [Camponotus japonicus]
MAAAMPRNETPQRTAGKRPLRALTPQEKLDAIKRVHEGESKASVARDIGVPESTLRGWCKAEHKIVSQVNTMKNSAHYERLSSPSESDRSTPGSSSRPPSANLTSAPSTSKESSEEAEPPAKRMKVDTTDIPSTSTNSGIYFDTTANQHLFASYLYSLMSQPALKNVLLEQQALMNNKSLLSSISHTASLGLDSGFSTSGYSTNNAISLATMMGNSMLPQRDLNGKRTRHRASNVSSLGSFTRTAPKRQSLSPIERENSLSLSVPSTSSGMVNGIHTIATPAMSKPDGKHINDIAQQLLKQKEEQQQQQPQSQSQLQPQAQPNNLSRNSETTILSSYFNNRLQPMRNILDRQPVPGNSVNNNNNNIHKNNNDSTNFNHRKSNFMDYLPPGIHEAADHGAKFVTWLRKHGSVFTFQQVKPVESIVEQIVAWAKPKEIKSNNKSNSMS